MSEIQLTDHLVAHIGAEGTCGRYRAKICEDGNFRAYIYAMSLKRLKRKCERYAKRERKAIAYVAMLKAKNQQTQQSGTQWPRTDQFGPTDSSNQTDSEWGVF